MQKRLLALLVTLVLTLSMFAGLALAAELYFDEYYRIINDEVTPAIDDVALGEDSIYTLASGVKFTAAIAHCNLDYVHDKAAALTQDLIDAEVMQMGVALAHLVQKDVYRVELSKDMIIGSSFDEGSELVGITILKNGNRALGEDFHITIESYDGFPGFTWEAEDGYVEADIPTIMHLGDHKICAKAGLLDIEPAILKVRYNITATPELNFTYTGEPVSFTMSGKITDRYGKPVDLNEGVAGNWEHTMVHFCTLDEDGYMLKNIMDGLTNAKGEFSFLVRGILSVGPVGIAISQENYFEVVHNTGKVVEAAAEMTVTPGKVATDAGPIQFTVNGSGFMGDTDIAFYLLKGQVPIAEQPEYFGLANAYLPDGEFTDYYFDWEPQSAGTYTLVANQGDQYEAMAKIVVANPVSKKAVFKGALIHRQGEFTFVQARQLQDMGASFAWNQTTRTATFIVGETKVQVTMGSRIAKVNGKDVTMPAAPYLSDSRTFIPVRFVSESLGWKVGWAVGDVVTITRP